MFKASYIQRFFTTLQVQRGWIIFNSRDVRIDAGDAVSVEAVIWDATILNSNSTVESSFRYHPKSSQLEFDCSCAELKLSPNRSCSHLWALALQTEAKGYLGQLDLEEDKDENENEDGHAQTYAPYWQEHIERMPVSNRTLASVSDEELIYTLNNYRTDHDLVIQTQTRKRKISGDWGVLRPVRYSARSIHQLTDPLDRKILSLFFGARREQPTGYSNYYSRYQSEPEEHSDLFTISLHTENLIIPLLCQTNRFYYQDRLHNPIRWDSGPPWNLYIRVTLDEDSDTYHLSGELRRQDEHLQIDDETNIHGHILFRETTASGINPESSVEWLEFLQQHAPFHIPKKEETRFLQKLVTASDLPTLDLPDCLKYTTTQGVPVPYLHLHGPKSQYVPYGSKPRVTGELFFEYDLTTIRFEDPRDGIFNPSTRTHLLRDRPKEQTAIARLNDLGFRNQYSELLSKTAPSIPDAKLPKAIRALIKEGWHIDVDGKQYRQPTSSKMRVSSGIDWFGIEGTVDFNDGATANIPTLLLAVKRGKDTIRLSDGSLGLIPEEWIAKYQALAKLGTEHEGELRYTSTQAALLDALLAQQPDVDYDAKFQETRERIRSFTQIEPIPLPPGFKGQNRAYQQDCLGWFRFLQLLQMGGCLADDMGVGKTIQVLAQLEYHRDANSKRGRKPKPLNGNQTNGHRHQPPRTSLAVVIPSVVFQWIEKAKKYTPKLKVLDHTESSRHTTADEFHKYDLVVTTYGTLIRDINLLKEFNFNYVILDEPEPVKNPSTQTAKAARLLKAQHRLALTGTPIENHLGEAWALFDFLSPGMLGKTGVLGLNSRKQTDTELEAIGNLLRPFILRRTKNETNHELPPLQEQILPCELAKEELEAYEELRVYFRDSLLKKADSEGANRISIHVFAALMKLRQATCHPGLIDPTRINEPSSKLALLHKQLRLLQEAGPGHKVLVFSQFTSFLNIIAASLEREKIKYERITGATPKRQRGVIIKRFESSEDSNVFLISLKAGGRGTDITAADYVYVMDPWWNPFAESQAIARAHRDEQTRPVFAYKMIATNTIEEKVLQLQETKLHLVNSIITAKNGMIRNLRREDIEELFAS